MQNETSPQSMQSMLRAASPDFVAGYNAGINVKGEPNSSASNMQSYLRGYQDALNKQGLSQDELQTLVSFMKAVLTLGAWNLQDMKESVSAKWELCNKDDPDTQVHFDNYSSTRKLYLQSKKLHNKLASIQGKLKKMKNQ